MAAASVAPVRHLGSSAVRRAAHRARRTALHEHTAASTRRFCNRRRPSGIILMRDSPATWPDVPMLGGGRVAVGPDRRRGLAKRGDRGGAGRPLSLVLAVAVASMVADAALGADNLPPLNGVPSSQEIGEDAALTFSSANGNPISVSDPDAGVAAVQVTLVVAEAGSRSAPRPPSSTSSSPAVRRASSRHDVAPHANGPAGESRLAPPSRRRRESSGNDLTMSAGLAGSQVS